MYKKNVYMSIIRYSASILFLTILWKTIIFTFAIPPYLFPQPETVLKTLWNEHDVFLGAAGVTFKNMLVGGSLGISLGVLFGFLIAYSRILRWLVEPYLTIFQSFPREALFPLIIVWLGFGNAPKVVNAALLSFFPIAIITVHGLLDTRHEYISLIQSWGSKRWEEFIYCRLPSLVPTLVGGIKVALPLALIGAVLGEFMGGNEGLGYIIISSGSTFRVDRIFAAVTILAVFGMSMLACLHYLQIRILNRFNHE